MKREKGNVGDIMIACFCMLAMTVVMLSYMDNIQLIQLKTEVSQLARKYILEMETVGYLTEQSQRLLTEKLELLGVTDIDYEGTTDVAVGYGEPITLMLQGKLEGKYGFTEQRVSTAKN